MREIGHFLGERDSDIRLRQLDTLLDHCRTRKADGKLTTPLLLYWGAGAKVSLDESDYRAILFLLGFMRALEGFTGLRTTLDLILTDTHALWNAYSEDSVARYFSAVSDLARDAGIEPCAMSALLAPTLRANGVGDTRALIDAMTASVVRQGVPEGILADPAFTILVRSAGRHSQRLSNGPPHQGLAPLSAEQAAYGYLQLNELERKVIDLAYRSSVFLTYSGELERRLFQPHLLTVQICSIERGQRARPWFLPRALQPA